MRNAGLEEALAGIKMAGRNINDLRYADHTTVPPSWQPCVQAKKQQLEPGMEQQTDSKLGKEYVKAVYCQLAD